MQKRKKKFGYGMVEIVVGSAIIASVLVATVTAVNEIRQLDVRTTKLIRANYLLLEGIDVVKILRDTSWSSEIATLSLGTPHYLTWDSVSWGASTSVSVIDGNFYRTISFSSVNRDVNDDIATIGALDAGTLKVTSSVSWSYRNSTSTKIFETYITDLYGN